MDYADSYFFSLADIFRRRPLSTDLKTEETQPALQRGRDPRLFHSNLSWHQALPRPQDPAQRFEIVEHLHDEERNGQDRRLRNRADSLSHKSAGQDSGRDALLHLARNSLKQALQL